MERDSRRGDTFAETLEVRVVRQANQQQQTN